MKKFFSFSFNLWAFIYLITTVHAQTTITNRVFPEAGDSIIFTLDTTVAGSALPQIGANQIWDYSILQSGIRRPEIYRAPNLGAGFATFPTATSMIRQGIQERYFRSNSNSFEELGYFITVGGGGGGLYSTGTAGTGGIGGGVDAVGVSVVLRTKSGPRACISSAGSYCFCRACDGSTRTASAMVISFEKKEGATAPDGAAWPQWVDAMDEGG